MTETGVGTVAQQLLDQYPPLGMLAGAVAVFVLMLGISLSRWCWHSVGRIRFKPRDR